MSGSKSLGWALLALSFWVGCAPEKISEPDEPDWLIAQDTMVNIMTDIHLVEGSRMGGKTIGDTLPTRVYFEKVWKKYGINRAIYDSNFRYYVRNAERMDKIYEKVLENLSQLEASLKTAKDRPTPSQPTTQEELDSVVSKLKQND